MERSKDFADAALLATWERERNPVKSFDRRGLRVYDLRLGPRVERLQQLTLHGAPGSGRFVSHFLQERFELVFLQ